jgi:hypothetical protein
LLYLSGIKNSNNNNNNNSGNCIVTVLDANDLPPLNSNTSLDSASPQLLTHNRRHENANNRNVLHRFFIFHRSDQSQA